MIDITDDQGVKVSFGLVIGFEISSIHSTDHQ